MPLMHILKHNHTVRQLKEQHHDSLVMLQFNTLKHLIIMLERIVVKKNSLFEEFHSTKVMQILLGGHLQIAAVLLSLIRVC